jgi:hypothetical protein
MIGKIQGATVIRITILCQNQQEVFKKVNRLGKTSVSKKAIPKKEATVVHDLLDFGPAPPATQGQANECNAFVQPSHQAAGNNDDFADFTSAPIYNKVDNFATFPANQGGGFAAFPPPSQNIGGFANFSNVAPSQTTASNNGFVNFSGNQSFGLQAPLNTSPAGFATFSSTSQPSDDFGAFESVPKKVEDPMSKLVSLDAFSFGSNAKRDSVGPSLNSLQSNKI